MIGAAPVPVPPDKVIIDPVVYPLPQLIMVGVMVEYSTVRTSPLDQEPDIVTYDNRSPTRCREPPNSGRTLCRGPDDDIIVPLRPPSAVTISAS